VGGGDVTEDSPHVEDGWAMPSGCERTDEQRPNRRKEDDDDNNDDDEKDDEKKKKNENHTTGLK